MEHGNEIRCERRDELTNEVQFHLVRLTELAREEIKYLNRWEQRPMMDMDKQIEEALGAKERCLGALKEHRRQHGC